ncbi:MAG TPA: PAS domain S-box protein [Longimicrobiaceae bacterium]|nr:PAS domain S-box protein [Longimicrobiaceae bacterium]
MNPRIDGDEPGCGGAERMELALQESENRLRSVVNSAPMILWALDSDGVFTFSEGSGLSKLGMSAGDVVGRSVFEVYRNVPQVMEDARRALNGEEFNSLVEVGDAMFEVGYSTVRAGDGSGNGVIGVAIDVTDRKRAEADLQRAHDTMEQRIEERTAELAEANEALEEEIAERERAEEELRRSEEHFRSLIENGSDLIIIVDLAGISRYMSPSAASVIGWSPEDRLGRPSTELIHPDDLPAVASIRDEALARPGTPMPLEFRYRNSSGAWVVLEGIIKTLAPDSAAEGLVVNVRDITARKRAELALRKSEEHFRSTVENISDLITIIEPDGTVRFESAAVERLFGYTPEELIGTHALSLTHPDDREATQEILTSVMQNPGTTRSAEFRFKHKDGSWRFVESVGATLCATSADEGVVVSSRDITERKQVQEELRHAKEEAERANAAKSEFLSRMSHELRTPMNSILGFAQLLEKKDLPADQRKGVGHILKAGRHLLTLINEVLDIARIEANRQHLSLEPVRLATVLHEALSLIRPIAAERGLQLDDKVEFDEDYFVRADRQRLTQVLLNLLSNAVKYNRTGGTVTLSCRQTTDEQSGDRRLCISVHDTGFGVPQQKIDDLFVPFARLGAEQSEVEGTGLGLALSKRLVEAMGGRLYVESTSGEGSTFSVELPRVDSPLEQFAGAGRPDSAQPKQAATRPATLLYIEDNLANLSLIESILSGRPEIQVLSALQGSMGLELAWQHLPDVILLDLHLPDLPGDAVLRRLRADERTRQTPVVVISADATARRIEQLMAEGADAYLTKPLGVDEFIGVIDRLLEGRSA